MTDTYELPELPDRRLEPGTMRWGIEYTAAEMKEYALLAVKQERERCAKLCEAVGRQPYIGPRYYDAGPQQGAWDCAAAIRGELEPVPPY